MRLIDADELIKCLDYCAWNDATEVVKAQPTAYDKEKVISNLEELKELYSKWCLCDYNDGARVAILEALSIVRRGVV